MTAPAFKRIAAGVYDSDDGRFNLYRIEGVNPPAWNVDIDASYAYDHAYDWTLEHGQGIVDGAATKRDALALFAAEYDRIAAELPANAEQEQA